MPKGTRKTGEQKNLPLFKWIGGKRWLTKELVEATKIVCPKGTDTYIEPFLGGGGAFFSLLPELKKLGIKKYVINDLNPMLMNIYQQVLSNHTELKKEFEELEKAFYSEVERLGGKKIYDLPAKDKAAIKTALGDDTGNGYSGAVLFFNNAKNRFNELKFQNKLTAKDKTEAAALLIFLQAHGFNGIYRENSRGEYNVPFNWSNGKPNTAERLKRIDEMHKTLIGINLALECSDVFALLDKYKDGDTFIYIDPPYLNPEENEAGLLRREVNRLIGEGKIEEAEKLNKTIKGARTENRYNADHFGFEEQMRLLEWLKKNKACFLYSNHCVSGIERFFKQVPTWDYKIVARKNIISASTKTRGKDKNEILGWGCKKT